MFNEILRKLNISEFELSPRLILLFLTTKTGIGNELTLKHETIKWYAQSKIEKSEEQNRDYSSDILKVSRRLLQNATLKPLETFELIKSAKLLEPYLYSDIKRKEYRHTLEIIEKICVEKKEQEKKEEKQRQAQKEISPDIKQYNKLLRQNVAGVMKQLDGIKKATIESIEQCLHHNTTSVFKYKFMDGDIIAKIEDIAEVKTHFLILEPIVDYDKKMMAKFEEFFNNNRDLSMDEIVLNFLKQRHDPS
jgi:hypothetical protein